jgi:hypothetical protein
LQVADKKVEGHRRCQKEVERILASLAYDDLMTVGCQSAVDHSQSCRIVID